MHHSKFVVEKTPYCVWEWDLPERNLEFIEGIDPDYFRHVAEVNVKMLDDEKHHQYAAVAIRTAYCHGLETLFSLICATIQAPDCVVGWLQKYQPKQVRNLVQAISSKDSSIMTKFAVEKISWNELGIAFNPFYHEDPEYIIKIQKLYGELWGRFARDFLDENQRVEYNHIKHGFRVKPGGFNLSLGIEETYGVPPDADKMKNMGGSKFGTTFFSPEPINKFEQKDIHFRVRRTSINWSPKNLAIGLDLISYSLHNILSFLKMVNGVDGEQVTFSWPDEEDYFMEPWKNVPSVLSIGIDTIITHGDVIFFSKKEIFEEYDKLKAK